MSGIGINLYDVDDTVSRVMAKQYIKYFQLNTAKSAADIQITAYGSLQSLFTTFQGKMQGLKDAFNTVAYQGSSSNTSAVSNVNVTNNHVGAGSHTVVVTQLAQAQQYTAQNVFSSKNTGLQISETLTFTNSANSANNFSVTINPNDSLEKIRDNINNSAGSVGISAAIIASTATDGSGTTQYSLVLTAQQGTANQFTVSGDTGNYFGFSQTATAQDAEFTFDGFNEVRSSNNITDVLDGLSFTLTGGTPGAPATSVITTSPNNVNMNSVVQDAVTDMLSSYNLLITFLDGNKFVTARDEKSHQYTTNVNSAFGFIKSQLQQAANTFYNGTGNIVDLRTAGIVLSDAKEVVDQYDPERKTLSKGSLRINQDPKNGSSTMTQLLTNNFSAVKEYFTDPKSGFIANLNRTIDKSILSQKDEGLIPNAIDTIKKAQGSTELQMKNEEKRLATMRENLKTQYSKLNGVISYYQHLSEALEKQYSYLDNMLRGK